MHYAVIAAGEGARFASEGVTTPKPLLPINGQPMIGRLLNLLARHRAQSISVIVNEQMRDVADYVAKWGSEEHLYEMGLPESFKFHLIVKSTPSSMHSLATLAEIMPIGKFCLVTVDAVFDEADFRRYIDTWELTMPQEADGLLAVTPHVDDERPLYVDVSGGADGNGTIRGFHDAPLPAAPVFVSGGIYGLDSRTAFPVLVRCLQEGQSRLRNFQRALVRSGLLLKSWAFDKILDIDHKSDIPKAEQFLTQRCLK